jgi:pSer/pThr/pTyr-binding forkhead associated (FHA) protein
MKISLRVISSGKWEGTAIPINVGEFVIGRDSKCQLRPASALISKRHCAIVHDANTAVLRDFGSTNGTFVDGRRVKGEVKLKNEQFLKIGPIEFMVEMEANDTAERTAHEPAASSARKQAEISTVVNVPAVLRTSERLAASSYSDGGESKATHRKQSSTEAARDLLSRYMKRHR